MNYKCMSKKVASLVIVGTILSSNAVYAADTIKKDESVYVTLNQNGVIKEKIVSDWLHSENAGISIKDKSELTGIKNIKGNEKPEISGDKLTWKSDKKDIFYQGKTDKKLPLEADIVYKLDGKEIKPQELAGKSGEVTINIKIKNTDAHKVTVNGKERTIYTPFAVATVVNLPIDKFTNVHVSEGEIISDGNNQAVTFITVPGLKESLNVDENLLDIDLKDEIEITADAKDFELAPIMMTATTKIPEIDKMEDVDKIDELQDKINDLKDATSKLEEGSNKLADGSSKLAENLNILSDGAGKLVAGTSQIYSGNRELAGNLNKFNGAMGQLSGGSEKLTGGIRSYTAAVNTAKNGAGKLNVGVPQLSKGVQDLGKGSVDYSNGAKQFAKSSDQYADGASELAETMKSKSGELTSGTNNLKNGSTKLAEGAKNINSNAVKMSDGLGNLIENTGNIKTGSENLVGAMDQGVNTAAQLKGAKQNEIEGINTALANMESLREVANSLEDSEQKSAMLGKIESQIGVLQSMKESSNGIVGGLSELQGGLGRAKAGAENLNDGISRIQQGQNDLYEGSKKLSQGANELSNGMSDLSDGAKKLNDGVSTLNPTLGEAVGKLNEGSKGLKAGADKLGGYSSNLMEGSNKFVSGSKEAVAGINGLYSGLSAIDANSNGLINGSKNLNKGLLAAKGATSQLSAGAGKLSSGAGQLSEKTGQLSSGANKLNAGANELSKGNKELSVNMTKFNNEGVKKIDDKLGTKITDVKEILDVKDEIVNLSKNYGTFTGLGDNMEGNVKFIMRTDEIKKPKEEEPKKEEKASAQDKTSAQKEEKGGISNFIKKLFS
ncbi:hypothetical protein FDF31_12900 [Clostridium sporogenes]|nr:hypothetical protein [Clostridium sporogenes]NFS26490.1 hypothetical protein [Clostridium sporogenes]